MRKIFKPLARRLFNEGVTIYLLPNKVRPDNLWQQPYSISKDREDERDFNKIVEYFEYYNCQYNELGRYTSYYIKYPHES